MSSLWTPDGEHRVDDARGTKTPLDTPARTHQQSGPGFGEDLPIDPETEARYRTEMDRLEEELLAASVGDVIANHCYGLFQLAAIHLGQQPPHLEQARLAIDALGAIVDGLRERIGDSYPTLSEGLAQVRVAFVQIAAANDGPIERPSDTD